MKAEWTPGPWRSEYDDNGFFFVDAANRPSPYVAATGGDGSENEANARLIATAPEMYAALRSIVESPHICCRSAEDHDCPLDQARAALAKATGPS